MTKSNVATSKRLRIDGKEVKGRGYMRGSTGKLCFSEEWGKDRNGYMKRIMDEENDWDGNMKGDEIEGPIVVVCSHHLSPRCGV